MVVQMRMIIFVILGLLSLCLAPALAQVSSPDLVAQAKKEGRVAWYTTVSIPESKQFIDMFEKEYPFIKVDLLGPVPAPGQSRRQRVRSEELRRRRFARDVHPGWVHRPQAEKYSRPL